jgi:hypothetical protein
MLAKFRIGRAVFLDAIDDCCDFERERYDLHHIASDTEASQGIQHFESYSPI